VWLFRSRDAVPVALELARDVVHDSGQVLPVIRCRKESARPFYGLPARAVRAERGHTLGQSYEVAQPGRGSIADNQMYVVGENGSAQQVHTVSRHACADGALHVLDRGLVDTANRFQVCQVTCAYNWYAR